MENTEGGETSIDTDVDVKTSKTGSVIVNTEVTVEVTLDEESLDEKKFVTIILVVIVCVIVIIASIFLLRLLMAKRQKKVVIDGVVTDNS